MKKNGIAAAVAAVLLGGLPAPGAFAGEREDLEALRQTTMRLLQLMQERGLLPRNEVEKLLKEAGAAASASSPASGPGAAAGAAAGAASGAATGSRTVRVPYVPETVRNQIKDELREEIVAQARAERWGERGALPEWLDRFSFEGDLRLRGEFQYLDENNAFYIDPQRTNQTRSLQLLNTTEDRTRYRVRARFGIKGRLTETLDTGFRIVTGSLMDPVSSTQTMGNYFNKYTISFDRAFLDWRPYDWVQLMGGRIGNPFFGTDLVWADDLSVDAGVVRFRTPPASETMQLSLTLAALPLQEVELSADDKWLYGAQAAGEWRVGLESRVRLGLAYYDYRNVTGIANPPGLSTFDYTAPLFLQKGNTLFNISSDPARPLLALASDYNLINLTGQVELPAFDEKRWTLTADYVNNTGFDSGQVESRVGVPVDSRTKGWQVRAQLGSPRLALQHDWQAFVAYKYLQRDAVMDAFTDPIFRLGGTDAKGYILGLSYTLDRNFWTQVRWFSADSIDGPPLKADVLQVDLNARF
jgi:hypothetical protein